MQVGGGITEENAGEWLEAGAEKVCLPRPNGLALGPR